MDELVSIVMPSYNTAAYIGDSIRSVLAQTYENWELLIVDDGSTDNTREIVAGFADERIRFFENETNSGAAVSRNRALREATGKWIAFLDSDDLWHPQKLKKQLAFMKENEYAVSYTDYQVQYNGQWLPYTYIAPNRVNKRKIIDYCYFSTNTVMYDVEKIGLIQIEPLRKNNDYAMWLKLLRQETAYRLPECLAYYLKRDGSISSGSKWKLIKHHYLLWRVGEHRHPVAATVLTVRNLFFGVLKKWRYKVKTEENLGYEFI